MPANQPWPEGQEIPFCTGCFENFFGINSNAVKYHRKLIDQRDIDVALRVFSMTFAASATLMLEAL